MCHVRQSHLLTGTSSPSQSSFHGIQELSEASGSLWSCPLPGYLRNLRPREAISLPVSCPVPTEISLNMASSSVRRCSFQLRGRCQTWRCWGVSYPPPHSQCHPCSSCSWVLSPEGMKALSDWGGSVHADHSTSPNGVTPHPRSVHINGLECLGHWLHRVGKLIAQVCSFAG